MGASVVQRLQEDLQDLAREQKLYQDEMSYLQKGPRPGILAQRHAARLTACQKNLTWVASQLQATRQALAREQVAA